MTFTRIEALRAVVEALPDAAFVVTCGATSREMAHVVDRPGNLYLLDSMGLTTSVGLGVAIGLASRGTHVVAIDGDGSLLMNLGSVATIGAVAPANLTVLLLDNGEHASAGGFPTISPSLDLVGLARSCRFEAAACTTPAEMTSQLRAAAGTDRPHFLRVLIDRGNTPGVPWLHADPVVVGDRFRTWALATAPAGEASHG